MLDMARLESGMVRLNRQWQPVEEVVGSAIAAIRPALQGRAVTVVIPEEVPLAHVDAVLLGRVLVNLLENTAKYTPVGTPVALGATVGGRPGLGLGGGPRAGPAQGAGGGQATSSSPSAARS
jgi:two-component system sensor histidine kinase KdpD